MKRKTKNIKLKVSKRRYSIMALSTEKNVHAQIKGKNPLLLVLVISVFLSVSEMNSPLTSLLFESLGI